MNLSFRTYIVVAFFFLWGCHSPVKKTETSGSLPESKPDFIHLPNSGTDTLRASVFADTVLYVPLETSDQTYLHSIRHIRVNDSVVAVSDGDKLCLFRYDGAFIRQIGKKGLGPGEYQSISNFRLGGDTIYLATPSRRAIMKYALDGTFLGEKRLNGDAMYFTTDSVGHLVWFDSETGKVYFCNARLQITDTLSVEPDFGAKGGDKILPERYRFERFGFNHMAWVKAAAPYQKIKMVETPDFLFLFQKGWTTEKILNTIYIYNRADKTIKRYDTPYIYDDLVAKRNLNVLYSSHDCLMAVINPFELKEELKKEQAEGRTGKDAPSPAWLKQMSQVKEDDNPILVIMKPRNSSL